MGFTVDFTGKVFGRLTVLNYVGKNKQGASVWNCRCLCGTFKIVAGYHLARGHTLSCKCLSKEILVNRSTKHGHNRANGMSPVYSSWSSMRARCNNPNQENYKNYGGRGIRVCKRWDKFENFLTDMGARPAGMTLERKNVAGNYCRRNCKWATVEEQNNNKRTNKMIEFRGQVKNLTQWCRELDLKMDTTWRRISSYGWSVEEAFLTPARSYARH